VFRTITKLTSAMSMLFVACAGAGVRPDDASAVEHRRAADEGGAEAAVHAQAARVLEEFEEERCHDISSHQRRDCPLRDQAVAVRDVPGGSAVDLRPGVDLDRMAVLARCHQAFGRARHFEDMPTCPLFVPGLDVQPSPAGRSLLITTTDPEHVRVIRERARALIQAQTESGGPWLAPPTTWEWPL